MSAGGASGSGGTDGGAPTSKLGAQCSSDSDCGQGLHCALPTGNEFGFGGPSRGYCTLACSDQSQCSALFPGSMCIDFGAGPADAYCLRGCDPSGASNCFDRYDELCQAYPGFDGGVVGTACAARCVTDNDCAGRKCDLYGGVCTDAPKVGDPVGVPCDPTASTDPCAGVCVGYSATDATLGACTAVCNLPAAFGIIGACGSDPQVGSPQEAACMINLTLLGGVPGGACAHLCDCDADCYAATKCVDWSHLGFTEPKVWVARFRKQGACVYPSQVPAGTPDLATCSQDAGLDAE